MAFINRIMSSRKTYTHRFIALFFVVVMFIAASLPAVQAYAETGRTEGAGNATTSTKLLPPGAAGKIKQDSADTDKPMQTDYAGPLDIVDSENKPAADAVLGEQSTNRLNGGGSVTPQNLNGSELQSSGSKRSYSEGELLEKRTANSATFREKDGKLKLRQYTSSKFYKQDGAWRDIDTRLVEDKNSGDAGNAIGQALGFVESLFKDTDSYQVKANSWTGRFAVSGSEQDMVRIKDGDDQMGFTPIGANAGVKPVVKTDAQGHQTVTYNDLWTGVDVEYEVKADELKESIILKSKQVRHNFEFAVSGAQLEKPTVRAGEFAPAYNLDGEGNLDKRFAIAPFGVVLNTYGPEDSKGALKHSYEGGKLKLSLEQDYMQQLPDDAYPLIIDPTITDRFIIGTRAGGSYVSYKSDGYVCDSTICNPYAGSVQDSGGTWRNWRGMMNANYEFARGKQIDSAKWVLNQRLGLPVSGVTDNRTINMWHASCFDYNCTGSSVGSVYMATSGVIDATNFYRARQAANDWGAWVMLTGEENVPAVTYKNFDPGNGSPYVEGSYLELTVSDILPVPVITSPVDGQVYVDPQVSISAGSGLTAGGVTLHYEFCISTGPQCQGAVMVSPTQPSPQWTVPDGILQDGMTYYVQSRSFDPSNSVYSNYGSVRTFKIDMRTGKDSTQAFDTLGPVSVDLATGNLTTSAASHSSSALGGSLGIGLDYNLPVKSRPGLSARYWNVPANYSGSTPADEPALTRVDQTVNFSWQAGSPSAGTVNNDWFFGQWDGYFTAPVSGSYYFGGGVDDALRIKVNNQSVYSTCQGGLCYGSAISLQAGQTVPIQVEYQEFGGLAEVKLYVKGPVAEQIVPAEWLQTGVRPVSQTNGLIGKYYRDPDHTKSFTGSNVSLMMQRIDPVVSFNWTADAAVPGRQKDADKWLARWTGYVTAPATGDYEFGADADDGVRIKVGNVATPQLDKWVDGSYESWASTSINLTQTYRYR